MYWNETETPLTTAVINNDIETVKKLKEDPKNLIEKNFQGFNGLELAKFLGRLECLEILEPQRKKILKVKLEGHSSIQEFSEEDIERVFGFKYIKYLRFTKYSLFKNTIQQCASVYRKEVSIKVSDLEDLKVYEGNPEIFTLKMQVYGEKIYQGSIAPCIVQWINKMVGYGLFADQDLKKGEFIGSYVGELRRAAFWILENNYSSVYPNRTFTTYFIDGKTMGNEMRFINHSTNPNLNAEVIADRGLLHSAFIASRDISKGEQLFWNYGDDFWANRDPPQEIF